MICINFMLKLCVEKFYHGSVAGREANGLGRNTNPSNADIGSCCRCQCRLESRALKIILHKTKLMFLTPFFVVVVLWRVPNRKKKICPVF